MATQAAFPQTAMEPSLSREDLILDHLPQVRWIATRIYEKLPQSVNLEDLISIGIIGLISAIDNFDPSHNAKLKTYAEYKIRGAILDSLRGADGIPAHKRKRVKQLQAAIAAAEQRLQRAPSDDEIARELNISLSEYHEWLLDVRGVSLGSLDAITNDGDGASMLSYLADDEKESPARLLEKAELEKVLAQGLSEMPPMERTVLSLYYKEELNLREIAPIVNLHITRVSQLKLQGVLRLRTYMEKQWPGKRGNA